MPSFAILISDATLLRCQVEVLKKHLRYPNDGQPSSLGLGYVEADRILLRKKPGNIGSLALSDLVSDILSEVLFFHAAPPGAGPFADENAMPLRLRRWMFMHYGALASPASTRQTLLRELPDYLQRQVKGTTASEACFLTFVRLLRDEGRVDDFDVPAATVGKLLAATARLVEKAERESGRIGQLGFFATNGRVLAATRLGSEPLYYMLLEGIGDCERCTLTGTGGEANPLIKAHRRVRAVAVATDVARGSGFIEVPEASVVTIGQGLELQVSPLRPLP